MFNLFLNVSVVHVGQTNGFLTAQLARDKAMILLSESTLILYGFTVLKPLALFTFEVGYRF